MRAAATAFALLIGCAAQAQAQVAPAPANPPTTAGDTLVDVVTSQETEADHCPPPGSMPFGPPVVTHSTPAEPVPLVVDAVLGSEEDRSPARDPDSPAAKLGPHISLQRVRVAAVTADAATLVFEFQARLAAATAGTGFMSAGSVMLPLEDGRSTTVAGLTLTPRRSSDGWMVAVSGDFHLVDVCT